MESRMSFLELEIIAIKFHLRHCESDTMIYCMFIGYHVDVISEPIILVAILRAPTIHSQGANILQFY